MNEYNYVNFPLGMTREDFVEFPHVLKAGEKAPDVDLVHASDGSKIRLSDYWSRGPVMIEFGSIT